MGGGENACTHFPVRSLFVTLSSRLLKNPHSPFENLRANGGEVEIIGDFPFVLRHSKHENDFFSSLLGELI
jgi:hypothetical protein